MFSIWKSVFEGFYYREIIEERVVENSNIIISVPEPEGSGLFFVGAGVINGERSESKPDLIIYLLNFQNRLKIP